MTRHASGLGAAVLSILFACATAGQGSIVNAVRDATGTRRIYWNPHRTAKVTLAAGTHHLQSVLGAVQTVRPHATITVGQAPVMASR